jgi:hypothetical protein
MREHRCHPRDGGGVREAVSEATLSLEHVFGYRGHTFQVLRLLALLVQK